VISKNNLVQFRGMCYHIKMSNNLTKREYSMSSGKIKLRTRFMKSQTALVNNLNHIRNKKICNKYLKKNNLSPRSTKPALLMKNNCDKYILKKNCLFIVII
jgi:hypothetical protein